MKLRQVIDIISIILPVLIILLGILRLFVKKAGWVNGLVMLSAVLLLLAGLIRYFILGSGGGGGGGHHNGGPKPPPITVSKHSERFNQSVEKVVTAYFSLTDAFVKGDTNAIRSTGAQLKMQLDSFAIKELEIDTLIYQTAQQPYENAKAEAQAIIADPSLVEKRASLNILSNEMFSLLSTARYDLAKLYWQECINAFGEDKPGNWLSKTEEAANPYGQKDCRELKTTIDFVPAAPPADSTKNK